VSASVPENSHVAELRWKKSKRFCLRHCANLVATGHSSNKDDSDDDDDDDGNSFLLLFNFEELAYLNSYTKSSGRRFILDMSTKLSPQAQRARADSQFPGS
jgi:hypothetical protein